MEDSIRRATANKRLYVNQRVSGAVGDYIEGPTKRRRRQRLYGIIVGAIGEKRYMVRFDNGTEKECASGTLRVEKMHASLPPDVNLPVQAPNEPNPYVDVNEVEEEVVDQDENEPLELLPDDEMDDADADDDGDNDVDVSNSTDANDNTGQELLHLSFIPITKDYASIKQNAINKIDSMVGQTVTVSTRNNGSMTWTVIKSHQPEDVIPEKEVDVTYGLKEFKSNDYKRSEIFCLLFLKLMFKDWQKSLAIMNTAIRASTTKTRQFKEKEFLIGLGILIGAAESEKRGCDLFLVRDQFDDDGEIDDEENWTSLISDPNFDKFMSYCRWKEFRRFFPEVYVDNNIKEQDPWYQFKSAVDEFNDIRKTVLVDTSWITIDESMSAWKPRTTATGGLPNISYIVRKPEPLGKCVFSFLSLACS
jgi:hypothetical protein